MKQAAPIIGPLEFSGVENNIILVEHDEDDAILKLLDSPLTGKNNIIFSSEDNLECGHAFNAMFTVMMQRNSIIQVAKIIKSLSQTVDFRNEFYIINRIDLFDLNFNKRERGAQVRGHLAMLAGKKTLRGANLIVSSCSIEYSLRELANSFLNLRK